MTVYCYFCGDEIGKVSWENQKEIREQYVDHLMSKHSFDEVAQHACWTCGNSSDGSLMFRDEAIQRHKEYIQTH